MSTRSVITFKASGGQGAARDESFAVYRHHDGYPNGEHGVMAAIRKARAYAWTLPRFEPGDFAAAFIRATKEGGGSVYITRSWRDHGDLDFDYIVSQGAGGELRVACYKQDDKRVKLFDVALSDHTCEV